MTVSPLVTPQVTLPTLRTHLEIIRDIFLSIPPACPRPSGRPLAAPGSGPSPHVLKQGVPPS